MVLLGLLVLLRIFGGCMWGEGGEYLGIHDEQVQRNIETVKPCLNTGIKATKELALFA